MKVYVASSFSLIPKVELIVEALEDAGHEITVKWWDRIYQVNGEGVKTTILKEVFRDLPSDEFYKRPETKFSFYADIHGIEDAEVFVFVADDNPRRYNGANIELGFAYGLGIPCFSIGKLMNSALYYEVVRLKTIQNLIEELALIEEE